MTLVEFLLARIAEDEALARAATPGPWVIDEHADEKPEWSMWAVDGPTPPGEKYEAQVVSVSSDRDYGNPEGGCERREDAAHIARHDPARVLAECEAKRRIVDMLGIADRHQAEVRRTAPDYALVRAAEGPHHALARAVQFLALPYADHPDYDETWRA